jgi:leucyl aminopeptidase
VNFRVEQGDIAGAGQKAVIVNLFQGVTAPGGGTGALDRALGGAISTLIAEGDITGKLGESVLIHTLGRIPAQKVLVVGLGKSAEFDVGKVRKVSAESARKLRDAGATSIASITHGAGIGGMEPEACAQAIAEGVVLGLYRYLDFKKPEEDRKDVDEFVIVEHDPAKLDAMRRGAERGLILAAAANHARDMANAPANHMNPTDLAARATALAEDAGLEIEVHERGWAESKGMGSFLSVANGSHQPPKFIVLRYKGGPDSGPHLGLVGKGITFDTGGISIKPAQGMEEMKGDMSGAAAVISAIWAIARLRPAVNVTAIAPATENMPGGNATRPGDVVRAMNGKTIEIINTDAEGRLILADALAYARELGLTHVVDVATLTGAVSVALGDVAVGVMTNDPSFRDRVMAAASAADEKSWELPLFDDYKEQIKSSVADLKNTGGRNAGTITAALFLKEFIEDTPWVHLDIAGVDFYDKDKGVLVRGASGVPVRSLVNLALEMVS